MNKKKSTVDTKAKAKRKKPDQQYKQPTQQGQQERHYDHQRQQPQKTDRQEQKVKYQQQQHHPQHYQNQQNQQRQYEYLNTTAMACRLLLSKSEVQARDKISELRSKVQTQIIQAEQKTLNDLRKTVLEEEKRITDIMEQAQHSIKCGDDAAFEETMHTFADTVVRFEDNSMLNQSPLSLGSVNVEDVTIAQMTACDMSSAFNKEDTLYHEIPSLNEFDRYKLPEEHDTLETCYENWNEISSLNLYSNKEHEHDYEFEACQFISAKSLHSCNKGDIAENNSLEYHNVETENKVEDNVNTNNAPSHSTDLPVYSNAQQQTPGNDYVYSGIKKHTLENVDISNNACPPGPTSIEQQVQVEEEKDASADSNNSVRIPNVNDVYKTVIRVNPDKRVTTVPTTFSHLSTNVHGDNGNNTQSYSSATKQQFLLSRPMPSCSYSYHEEVHSYKGNGKSTVAGPPLSNNEPVYATSNLQREASIQSHCLFGGGEGMSLDNMSNDPKQDIVDINSGNGTKSLAEGDNITEYEHVTDKITKWKTFHPTGIHILSETPHDSYRLAILSDGRLFLLCESEDTMTLFDQHFKPVKTQTIKCPKVVCSAKDDLVALVQSDDHNDNILLVEAKANYLKVLECKTLEYEEKTVEIKYRDNRYYLGCCTFKVYVHNEKFEKIWIINCGELRCPMISFDYNHVTGTLYTVNSNGALNCVKDTNTGETDSFKLQGIAVSCHGEKAYILCEQERYKVVEIYQDQEKGFQQRPVIIILAGSIPIDICLSSDGSVLMILLLKETFLSVENYSVKTQFLTNANENK